MNDNDAAASGAPDPDRLSTLRARIDALDERLHTALIERSAIIDELIVAKGSRASAGAIFRPGREAQMMRRLVERHEGSLALGDIEHLWHVIIAAHTALQAPFEVFVDVSADPLPSWDAARLLVGFTVPVAPCGGSAMVIEAMSDALGDGRASLGLVPVATRGPWWRALGPQFQVMARTPAMRLPGDDRDGEPTDVSERHDARAPHWVIAPILSDPVPFDVPLAQLRVGEGMEREPCVLDAAADGDGAEWWLVEGEPSPALRDAALDVVNCGGYHAPAIAPA